ncbi:MAG: type 1 glutamine amidotransferase [Chlorobiaceae bacterium]|nr:type 1 glutamine amidotransferase [Chlorobiaceae bacterium]
MNNEENKKRKKLLIVRNIAHEGPGMLAELLEEYSLGFELYDLSKGDSIPDPRNYAGVVVLGGPQSANDTTPQIRHGLQRIRETLDAGVPFLGICLGLQLLVAAAGGRVVRCHRKEIGFRDPDGFPFMVQLTSEGKRDALFNGIPENLRVFQLHGETVMLGDGMILLAKSRGCENQIVRLGSNAWGLQCHFEMTDVMFKSWMEIDPDLMALDREELLTEFDAIRDEYEATGRTILLNFLAVTGLVNK